MVCAEQVSVRADPRLVDAVVNNFVSNAIRYTPAGGRVRILAQRRRSAVIAVRDTGMGIAPEHLERIFDRLYRVDEARDRATGGFGARPGHRPPGGAVAGRPHRGREHTG